MELKPNKRFISSRRPPVTDAPQPRPMGEARMLAGAVGSRSRPRSRWLRMSGYKPRNAALYRAWNMLLAVVLILFSLPLLSVIAAALAITQGPRNVFYTGTRIGKDGQLFPIIKFKTLRNEAAQLTADKVLPADSQMETALGKPLRETRLDELPQLFNVLLGHMNMLGPRPVRAAISEQWRDTIPDYDKRFSVKPGLIGYTQALMPHSASKPIRARLNARLCDRPVNLVQEALFLGVTALSVLLWTLEVGGRMIGRLLHVTTPYYAERHGVIEIQGPGDAPMPEGLRLLRVDAATFQIETPNPLPTNSGRYSLVLRWRCRWRPRAGKTVRCLATIEGCETVTRNAPGRTVTRYRYTMGFRPATSFQKYLIDRYFVGAVLVR